jgi:N-acetylmuramoyl-L-alanine amidase
LDVGLAVADVQRRLSAAGFATNDPEGVYGRSTRVAVEAFQHRRGLRVDGVCGRQTWDTLVEAGFRLGDRFLYLRTPMLRGDDVADLQRQLGGLGFDPGRVDGIFGPLTSAAVADFQRNAGQPVDGIVGLATVRDLLRMPTRTVAPELVSNVRAREELRRAPPTLSGRHLGVGESGGLSAMVASVRRRLASAGARVTEVHHPDGSAQAAQANNAQVDAYLAISLDPDTSGCSTAYYAGYRYESPGGRRLAELIQAAVPGRMSVPDHGTRGMSVPVLRETRMAAVIVEVGPASLVVEGGPELARSLVDALTEWATTHWD